MKGSRILPGIFLGILISVAAFFAARTLTVCLFEKASSHWILIDPQGNIVDPQENEAVISLKKHHKIKWETTDGSPLSIEFEKSELQKNLKGKDPFVNMRDSNDKNSRVPYCNGGQCVSDEINSNLSNDLSDVSCPKVKYYQVVNGKRVDGWIIVKG